MKLLTKARKKEFEDHKKDHGEYKTIIDLPELLAKLEKQYFTDALKLLDGNKTLAAKFLGINRTTFQEKCKKMGLK